jgi:hypothetical protein
MNVWRKETMAYQEVTEACLESEEPTSLETESIVVHDEVPTEKAAVKPVRALKMRLGDQHLVIQHCGKPKEWTQVMVGPRRSWPPPAEG